jgi:hypothetical protein
MSAAGIARTFFGILSLAELHHARQDALHVHFGKNKRGYLQKEGGEPRQRLGNQFEVLTPNWFITACSFSRIFLSSPVSQDIRFISWNALFTKENIRDDVLVGRRWERTRS